MNKIYNKIYYIADRTGYYFIKSKMTSHHFEALNCLIIKKAKFFLDLGYSRGGCSYLTSLRSDATAMDVDSQLPEKKYAGDKD